MTMREIKDGLSIVEKDHAITGVLRHGEEALLINAVPQGLLASLRASGIEGITNVLLCHHRRDISGELGDLLAEGHTRLVVPESERALFENPGEYWGAEASRWRLLCGHVPYHATQVVPVPVDATLIDGETLTWHEWRIRAVATPGYTDGSLSFLVRRDGWEADVAFTGDLIWGPGMVRDLYSLQHAVTRNGVRLGDYHGFCGSMWSVLDSLDKVVQREVSHLIPAHGVVIERPREAVALLRARFTAAYHNYVSISALRWYYPGHFEEHCDDTTTLPTQVTVSFPPAVRRLAGTTWVLVAEDGHALLIDPYCDAAVDAAAAALEDGTVAAYDGIWLTHYHHDHVEAAEVARRRFRVPIMTDTVMAEVVAHPERFYLTCLSPAACRVDQPTRDGQTWRWRNMTLTAYHFPGQTYYHSGLFVVPDQGPSLFFAGDAFTPTGIDDYCSWNRNWLKPGVGYDRCIKLLRHLDPDSIFNQHVDVGFHFDDEAMETMLTVLGRREELYRAMLPYEHADMGTDEYWVHTYPYEQRVAPGATATVQVRVWNHLDRPCRIEVLPAGGTDEPTVLPAALACLAEPNRESSLEFRLAFSPNEARDRVIVPFRVRVDDMDFGPFREAIFRMESAVPPQKDGDSHGPPAS